MNERMLIAESELALREKLAREIVAVVDEDLLEMHGENCPNQTAARIRLISSAVFALAVLIVLLYTSRAVAHSWYPPVCCSEQDCRSLDEDRGEFAIEQHDSWKLWDGRVIQKASTQRSPDGKFHLCETSHKKPLCFFVPPGAV